jgi:hypothetical protein
VELEPATAAFTRLRWTVDTDQCDSLREPAGTALSLHCGSSRFIAQCRKKYVKVTIIGLAVVVRSARKVNA